MVVGCTPRVVSVSACQLEGYVLFLTAEGSRVARKRGAKTPTTVSSLCTFCFYEHLVSSTLKAENENVYFQVFHPSLMASLLFNAIHLPRLGWHAISSLSTRAAEPQQTIASPWHLFHGSIATRTIIGQSRSRRRNPFRLGRADTATQPQLVHYPAYPSPISPATPAGSRKQPRLNYRHTHMSTLDLNTCRERAHDWMFCGRRYDRQSTW